MASQWPATAQIANESDVEQKIIYPLLVSPQLLRIPEGAIRTKSYLAPTALDSRPLRSRIEG
jgi:hypothetical protein